MVTIKQIFADVLIALLGIILIASMVAIPIFFGAFWLSFLRDVEWKYLVCFGILVGALTLVLPPQGHPAHSLRHHSVDDWAREHPEENEIQVITSGVIFLIADIIVGVVLYFNAA